MSLTRFPDVGDTVDYHGSLRDHWGPYVVLARTSRSAARGSMQRELALDLKPVGPGPVLRFVGYDSVTLTP